MPLPLRSRPQEMPVQSVEDWAGEKRSVWCEEFGLRWRKRMDGVWIMSKADPGTWVLYGLDKQISGGFQRCSGDRVGSGVITQRGWRLNNEQTFLNLKWITCWLLHLGRGDRWKSAKSRSILGKKTALVRTTTTFRSLFSFHPSSYKELNIFHYI